jgi:hypothetical protein
MRLAKIAVACVAAALLLCSANAAAAVPRSFFGISPQKEPTESDVAYMAAGGIGSIRVAVPWGAIQPTAAPVYTWWYIDPWVERAARYGIGVLPVLGGSPSWLEAQETTLPVGSSAEREAWAGFVAAAVQRYGPGGSFWREHGPASADPLPERPVRTWQIWNEANFHYFAYPVSPASYGQLIEATAPAIRAVDPSAQILLAGLFGEPNRGGLRGMAATKFLADLYRIPGLSEDFDGVALHPYAPRLSTLRNLVEGMHRVVQKNHDNASLYITEVGWGSQFDPKVVAFEKGPTGQARELNRSYRYLIKNRVRLRLRGVYWFSWKDLYGTCSFCDSSGLFDAGEGFQPKPAWSTFVKLTGGRTQP